MILDEKYTLNNGVQIPKIGLGTWMISDSDVVPAIKEAVKAGYTHIETAQAYGNENGVGIGVRDCGLNRDQIFVSTKLAAEIKDFAKAIEAIDGSLSKMKLDHIDMMLIHSPQPWMKFGDKDRYEDGNREAWRALEAAYKAGKLRAIGISNFLHSDIDSLIETCKVQPMANQILAHISNTPLDLIEYSQSKGMLVEAYSPIAHGELLKNEEVAEMAQKYGVSIAQLSIRYTLQLGMLPLPKTTNPAHIRDNADVNFEISAEDMESLKNIEPIKDYGAASMFPVFGGSLKPTKLIGGMVKRLFNRKD